MDFQVYFLLISCLQLTAPSNRCPTRIGNPSQKIAKINNSPMAFNLENTVRQKYFSHISELYQNYFRIISELFQKYSKIVAEFFKIKLIFFQKFISFFSNISERNVSFQNLFRIKPNFFQNNVKIISEL